MATTNNPANAIDADEPSGDFPIDPAPLPLAPPTGIWAGDVDAQDAGRMADEAQLASRVLGDKKD